MGDSELIDNENPSAKFPTADCNPDTAVDRIENWSLVNVTSTGYSHRNVTEFELVVTAMSPKSALDVSSSSNINLNRYLETHKV